MRIQYDYSVGIHHSMSVPVSLKGCNGYSPTATPWVRGWGVNSVPA